MSSQTQARLVALGITLPAAPAPAGSYTPCVQAGGLLFVSGQLSRDAGGTLLKGTLGAGTSLAEGQAAARACALNILAQAQAALGDLDRIQRIVRLNGFVASTAAFQDHPQVVNGASELLAEILGERGVHTRIAVGVASLPGGAAVEIDAVIAVQG